MLSSRRITWLIGAVMLLQLVPVRESAAVSRLAVVPNDPLVSKQWALGKINLPAAWEISTGSDAVTVAILDSGVDTGHPDLAGRLLPGFNVVTNDPDVTDTIGHGTHVAGIIGASGNNGIGVAGVTWGARLLPVKVTDADGSIDSSSVAAGLRWAVDHGARVINFSFGDPEPAPDVKEAIDYAYGKGALVVAAGGNCATPRPECRGQVNPVIYPASYEHVIAVAATTNQDTRASFSETGPYVKLAAPGGEETANPDDDMTQILSTAPRSLFPSGYRSSAGTSEAAPFVSGLAALVWSVNPALTNAQVEEILIRTATDLGPPGKDDQFGYGKIDALAALQVARASLPPTLQAPADNASLPGLGTALRWQNPAGALQYHIQVLPANDDGPGINLIVGDAAQVAAAAFTVPAPAFGIGPYVMLPGMNYAWRVRTSGLAVSLGEASPGWGTWSAQRRFRTPGPSAATLSPVSPQDGSPVPPGPLSVQWKDSNLSLFYYEVQVSPDRGFNLDPATATTFVYWNLVHGGVSSPPNSWKVPDGSLPSRSVIYWRVRPRVQGDGTPVDWGPTWAFNIP